MKKAEHSERTRRALAEQVPLPSRQRAVAATRAKSDAFARKMRPIFAELEARGIVTYYAVARTFNELKIPSARGGIWTGVQVELLLKRIAGLDSGQVGRTCPGPGAKKAILPGGEPGVGSYKGPSQTRLPPLLTSDFFRQRSAKPKPQLHRQGDAITFELCRAGQERNTKLLRQVHIALIDLLRAWRCLI